MIQNLQKRKCQDHNNKQIWLACYNKFCKEKRLVCQKCLDIHSAHTKDLINDEEIEEKAKLSQQSVKQFIKQLNEQFDELTLLFKKLIQLIETTFYISNEKMNGLDNQQLNSYLNQLITQDEQQQKLNKIFIDVCKQFDDKIAQIIELKEFSIIKEFNCIEIKKENTQDAQLYFQYGYDYYYQQDYAKAIEQFDLALKQNGNHLISYFLKGDSLRIMGEYYSSIVWYEKALQIDPQFQSALQGKYKSQQSMEKEDDNDIGGLFD